LLKKDATTEKEPVKPVDDSAKSQTGYPEASVSAKETTSLGDTLELTYEKLDTEAITATVKDDGAGAIAVFIGTTRDSFQGERTRSVMRAGKLRWSLLQENKWRD
jgi:hypothetical protein